MMCIHCTHMQRTLITKPAELPCRGLQKLATTSCVAVFCRSEFIQDRTDGCMQVEFKYFAVAPYG